MAVVDKELRQGANTKGYRLFINAQRFPGVSISLGASPVTVMSPQALPADDSWHHLLVRARRSVNQASNTVNYTFELMVDGESKGTGLVVGFPITTVANTGKFRIGQNSYLTPNCVDGQGNPVPATFNGAIDEVELFGRYLSDAEVTQLAHMTKCKCTIEVCNLVQFGPNTTSRTVRIQLCNFGATAADIPWQI